MGWTDTDVLDTRVRRLNGEGIAAFVTDLWTARGFETDREGPFVVAHREGERRVLYVLTKRTTTPSVGTSRSVDIVVAPRRPQAGEALAADLDARFLDTADLTEMIRYALERDAAADLCEAHFGATPDELRYPPRERVRRRVGRLEVRTVAVIIVASLVVAVGASAAFGLAGTDVANSGTPDEAAITGGTPATAESDEPAASTTEGGSTPTTADITDPSTVPGVSETSITNASRLARAHAAVVSDTASYTIWFDYYAPNNGSSGQVQHDVDVRVQGERIFVRESLERSGGNRSVRRTAYYDGRDRYVAENGTNEFSRIDDRPPTATPREVRFTRPGEVVQTYLATSNSSVSPAESDTRGARYRLQSTGRPAALSDTVTDYKMTAIVDKRGFIWALEAEFTVRRDTDGDGVSGRERVRLTWTYDRINSTEVRSDLAPTTPSNSSA
ncbi:MAG: hypothetical protein ABEI27_09865 [Halobellus sp.]|uniref:hypothetical protein n=1 Tax=Halobellus sp. TaxID=1979212 RepID=UPI0035D48D47